MELNRTELYLKTKEIIQNYSTDIKEKEHGDTVVFGGFIKKIKDFRFLGMTEEDEPEVFLTIEDPFDEFEITLVPASLEMFENTYGPLKEGQVIYGLGKKFILDTTHKVGALKRTLVFDNHDETSRIIVAELKLLD